MPSALEMLKEVIEAQEALDAERKLSATLAEALRDRITELEAENERMWIALHTIEQECWVGRADGPSYDTTLDHLYEVVRVALAAPDRTEPAEEGS